MSENTSISILLEVVDKASPELKKFQENLKSTEASMKSFALGLARVGAAAAATAVVGLAAMTKSAINTADEIGKAAQKVGISTESLSALTYAAKLADVSFEGLQTGLKKLSTAIIAAQVPGSEMADTFKRLGVNVVDSSGKTRTADAVFADLAEKFKKAPDDVNKTAIAMRIFGKSGADLIPLLNSGKTGLEEMRKEAERLGVIYDTETTKRAEEFNDTLTKLSIGAGSLGLVLAKELLPTLQAIAKAFLDGSKTGEDFQRFAAGVGRIFIVLVKAASGFLGALSALADGFSSLGKAADLVGKGELSAALDVMADWKKRTDEADEANLKWQASLTASTTAVKKETDAKDDNTGATGASLDARLKNTAAIEAEQKAYDKAVIALLKEADSYKQLTSEEQIHIQVTKGGYKNFTDAHKQRLMELAKEVDANRVRDITAKEGLVAQQNFDIAFNNFTRNAQDATTYFDNLATGGKDYADAMQLATMALRPFNDEIIATGHALAQAQAAGETKKVQELTAVLAAKTAELDARQAEIEKKALATSAILAETSRTQNAWNTVIGNAVEEMKNLNKQAEIAKQLFDAGTLSAHDYAAEVERIDLAKIDLAKQKMTEFDKTSAKMALSFQDMFSSTFYDAMQGQFDLTFSGFKKMMDKMIAEALARKLATYLFGDVTRTGQTSSSGVATDLLGGIIKMFGFRETGGDVQAGKPYIVGEKRAELFVPNVSGTILPSLDAAKGMSGGSNSLTVHIQAMDSQDVLRAMDSIKRPLAEMLNGTNRSYNLGAR